MAQPIRYTRKVTSGDITRIYSKDFKIDAKGIEASEKYQKNNSKRKLKTEKLHCEINKVKKEITIVAPSDFPVEEIKVIGTSSLSRIKGTYTSTGGFAKGFGAIIKEILNCVENIKALTIDYNKKAKTKLRKRSSKRHLTIAESDYNYVHGLYQHEKKVTKDNAKIESIKYLNKKVDEIDIDASDTQTIVTRDFKNQIFQQKLSELSKKEIQELIYQLYTEHSEVFDSKIELFKETDTYKLDYIIEEYERHLKDFKDDESEWQKFFESNFNIINPSYKYVIREVDTIFESLDIEATSRPVDFIGVDIYNNVELIELKTPNARVLSTQKDRNNYYLVHKCTKACTQLEKYLICIESNKTKVERLIKKKISNKYGIAQKDINLIITKPKAKLIIGTIKSIISKPSRHQDFQLQRHSFKNIELITFDEILNSLKEIKRELRRKKK